MASEQIKREVTLSSKIENIVAKEPTLGKGSNKEYFTDCHWGHSLELLGHLSKYSERILLVTGQEGVGKTTLKQAYLDRHQGEIHLCSFDAKSSMDTQTVMRRVAQGFGLPWDEARGADIWGAPGRIVAHQSTGNSLTWVLLIDDAHELSWTVISSLLELVNKGVGIERQLHLVFIGDLTLEQKFSQGVVRDLSKGRLHVIELEPLALNEIESYLNYKKEVIGDYKDHVFTQQEIKKINIQSGGVFKDVNRYANEICEKGGISSKSFVKTLTPFIIGLLIVAGLFYFATSILTGNGKNKTFVAKDISELTAKIKSAVPSISKEKKSVIENVDKDAKLQEFKKLAKSSDNISETEKMTKLAISLNNRNIESSDNKGSILNIPSENLLKSATIDKVTDVTKKTDNDLSKINPKVKVDISNPSTSLIKKKIKSSLHNANATKPSDKVVKANANVKNTKSDANKLKVVTPKTSTKASAKKSTSKSKKVAQKPVVKNSSYYEDLILKTNSENYTIQLLGSASLDNINKFISENKLEDNARYFKTVYNSRIWYIVVYGDYKTKKEVVKTIQKLPANLKRLNPWQRKYGDVKEIIKARRSN